MHPALPKLTEAAFMVQVIQFAHLRGFKVAHFRTVRVQRANGRVYHETPVAADGSGFPDLILVRPRDGRLVVLELKVGKNTATPEQEAWIAAFAGVPGALARVVYPEQWNEIERLLA